MAVFRSDQAQVTFAAEAAQGGDFERLGTTTATAGYLAASNSANAGDTSIVATGGTYVVGDFIRIGDTGVALANSEIRRVEHLGTTASPWTLHLDRPLAFYHPGGGSTDAPGQVDRVSGQSTTILTGDGSTGGGRKYITFLPGIYETVDVPDPEMAIEPRYFLGTESKRNFFQAYKGQQTFNGAMGDMILLNGWPLRFPIGSVITVPSAIVATSMAVAGSAAVFKGDVFIKPAADYTSTLSVGDYLLMDYIATPKPTSKCEVRRVIGITSAYIEVDYPFMFGHIITTPMRKVDTTAAGFYYRHHIVENVDLDTVSWHVHMRDSGETSANDFDRRYVGGMVGSMTLAAEEGGLLTCGWDGVPFTDMIHNQKGHTGVAGPYGGALYSDKAATDISRYAMMQKILAADVNQLPGATSGSASLDDLDNSHAASASTEPYYFSRGSIKFNDTVFARIRSFSLSITNNEEPRYYINQRFGNHRGPNEIREQQREYSMSATVALPDTVASTSTSLSGATALFKELLLEGDYGTGTSPNMKGFSASLEFVRGTNDRIIIDMPGSDAGQAAFTDPGTVIAPLSGGNNQGLFIRTAPHSITGDNPLQAELDLMVRNLRVTVDDNIAVYP